ncbi:hypothetical protein BpHYR1_041228 [Brachionus plicatilis]|uniref:Uncharacterized protein n=1 Tax=Brachionus plicatilis TaxID=10195 RepID=A0A3M7PQD0_BRAPC|nr:hypothetical protein BpHYR1_041228 [Brachionus plicatilis]
MSEKIIGRKHIIEIKQLQTITNEEIATKYGCDPSCISKILKNKEKYLKEADTRTTKKWKIKNGMFEIIFHLYHASLISCLTPSDKKDDITES